MYLKIEQLILLLAPFYDCAWILVVPDQLVPCSFFFFLRNGILCAASFSFWRDLAVLGSGLAGLRVHRVRSCANELLVMLNIRPDY